MKAFTTHKGIAAPLPTENVDTDVIIPMAPLMMTPRGELGQKAFMPLRYREDGSEAPEFVLNQAPYRRASILVAGRNFGCGSSREGAVHALEGLGIRVVIAPSFGDIFFGNCIKNGVLPVILEDAAHESALQAAGIARGETFFNVSLPDQTVTLPDGACLTFDFDPGHKVRLLEGMDEIALTEQYRQDVLAYQEKDRRDRPWIWAIEHMT